MFAGSCVATVIAGIVGYFGVGGGRGAVLGTVSLAHEVADAKDCGVVDQVSAAYFGIAVGAGRVRSQGLAELQVKAIEGRVELRR